MSPKQGILTVFASWLGAVVFMCWTVLTSTLPDPIGIELFGGVVAVSAVAIATIMVIRGFSRK